MDNTGSDAVVKILENAGVKKIRFSAKTPPVIVSNRKLTPEEFAHGESFVENFIEHFGVKGMRWGVRRSQKQLDREAGRSKGTDDVEERASKTKSKGESKNSRKPVRVQDLSDADLRAKLNRMNMEQQYAQLTAPKANPLRAAGKKVAANVVKGVAEQTLKNIGQSYSTKYTAQYMANYKAPIPRPPMLNPLRGAPKTPRMG